MSAYIRLSDSKYPLHEGDAINEYGSLQAAIDSPTGYRAVQMTERPAHNRETHVCLEGEPVLVDWYWQSTWQISELSAEDLAERQAMERLRQDPAALARFFAGQTDQVAQNLNAPGGQPDVIG